jgi:hypothetical protein
MNSERLKICLNMLRIFIRLGERGNYLTLHTDEIENSLCRSMCKRSVKDRKYVRDQLLALLNALKDKGVFFLGQDDWSDDRLLRPKKKDKKKVYGLTDRAIKFLDLQKAAGNSCESNDTIKRLLQHFDVIDALEPPVQEVINQPAKTTAPEIIETEENATMPLRIITDGEPFEHLSIKDFFRLTADQRTMISAGVFRSDIENKIVAQVKKASAEWPTPCTPADFLGCLSEFYGTVLDYDTANKVASAVKLGWPDTKRPQYQACRDLLVEMHLVRAADTRADGNSPTGLRSHGLTLTYLGFVVARNFKDERPAGERAGVIRYPNVRSKVGPMNKDKKEQKEMPATGINNPQIQAMVARLVKEQVAAALGRPVDEPLTETTTTAPKTKSLSRYETIGALVKSAIGGFCSALVGLNKPGNTPKTEGINATDIDAVFCAITEIERSLSAMKIYIHNCIANHSEPDENKLDDYNALISLQCETLERDRELSTIVALNTVKLPNGKRSLTGPFAIKTSVMTEQLI